MLGSGLAFADVRGLQMTLIDGTLDRLSGCVEVLGDLGDGKNRWAFRDTTTNHIDVLLDQPERGCD